MQASKLYQQLEKDFIFPGLSDDWARHMDPISDFLSDNFKKRSMGLVCDFTPTINQVYTAVFPSRPVMEKILADDAREALLFVHHPSTWDIRKEPVFQLMDRDLLKKFKENKIAIYNLHVPLDNYSEYSTSVTFARALGIKAEQAFVPYFGALCGVWGRTDLKNLIELKERFEKAVHHKVSLYPYGGEILKNDKIAVVAGGGNDLDTLQELLKEKINVLITGITAQNEHSKEAHEFAKKNKISLLGGTHYSTEKFACEKMVDYFRKAGLKAEFLPDQPVLADL